MKKRLRVLLIDVNCKNSSTGQIAYNLYSYLNAHGDYAAICYGRGKSIHEKNIYKFGIDIETYIHAFLTRITGLTGCFSYFSTKRLIKYIDKFNPDIVHIHELHAYFVNISQLLNHLAKKRIRVVHTLHCEFSYTGKCGHSIDCDKWKNECDKCPHLKDYPSTLCFDHTRYMFNEKKRAFLKLHHPTYVVPSTWLYKRIKQSFLKHEDIRLIHNSIDTSIFHYQDRELIKNEKGINRNTKVVLALAPDLMSDNKGGKYVMQVAQKMQNVLFILIGTGHKPYKKENVHDLGNIYDKYELAKYYSLADAFVICSKNENFPTTCIEAICCGTPIVGFDAGGAREVAPGNLGTFVQYGNVEALVTELNKIIYNNSIENLRNEFHAISNHYSIKRMCEEYRSVYICENEFDY